MLTRKSDFISENNDTFVRNKKKKSMFETSHLHPMLVHFPIALVVFGFLADVGALLFKKEICLTKAGFYMLIIGTLAAVVTWLSGFIFTSDMSGAAGVRRETHELFATVTVILLVITSVFRIILMIKKADSSGLKWVVLALYGLAAFCVTITGFYGGTLVYVYMMPL
jgi:uncharacterized membrane protein